MVCLSLSLLLLLFPCSGWGNSYNRLMQIQLLSFSFISFLLFSCVSFSFLCFRFFAFVSFLSFRFVSFLSFHFFSFVSLLSFHFLFVSFVSFLFVSFLCFRFVSFPFRFFALVSFPFHPSFFFPVLSCQFDWQVFRWFYWSGVLNGYVPDHQSINPSNQSSPPPPPITGHCQWLSIHCLPPDQDYAPSVINRRRNVVWWIEVLLIGWWTRIGQGRGGWGTMFDSSWRSSVSYQLSSHLQGNTCWSVW